LFLSAHALCFFCACAVYVEVCVAGSWGVHWGEGGLFRIRRGTNECEIEDEVAAGIPLLEEGQRLVGGGGEEEEAEESLFKANAVNRAEGGSERDRATLV